MSHDLNKYLVFCIFLPLTIPVDKDNTMPNHMFDIQRNIIQYTVLFQLAPDMPTSCYKNKIALQNMFSGGVVYWLYPLLYT